MDICKRPSYQQYFNSPRRVYLRAPDSCIYHNAIDNRPKLLPSDLVWLLNVFMHAAIHDKPELLQRDEFDFAYLPWYNT